MKHIRLFKTQSEFENSKKIYPQTTYVEETKKVIIEKKPIVKPIPPSKNGIYIYEINNTFTPQAEWNGSKENTVGVAVIQDQFKFLIAKEDVTNSPCQWGSMYKYIDTTHDNGVENTDKIIKNDKTAQAANDCKNHTFPNGIQGYLGALNEWKTVYDNKTIINEAMEKIGGTILSINEPLGQFDNYWTSTQYDTRTAFAIPLTNGKHWDKTKENSSSCRAFGAF